MPNKALRILIADEQHFHRMKIERLFNALGYYRVAPVQSLGEMLTLVEYGSEPFDLVVINASMAGETLGLHGFLLDNPQVRHALVYNAQARRSPMPVAGQGRVQVSHAFLPDQVGIQRLMTAIDPPFKDADQPWLTELYKSQMRLAVRRNCQI